MIKPIKPPKTKKPFAQRPRKYVEPDPNDPKYKDGFFKVCTVCERTLPCDPDFFSVHAVREYRYRRPECRSCRSEMMREKRMSDRLIEQGGK